MLLAGDRKLLCCCWCLFLLPWLVMVVASSKMNLMTPTAFVDVSLSAESIQIMINNGTAYEYLLQAGSVLLFLSLWSTDSKYRLNPMWFSSKIHHEQVAPIGIFCSTCPEKHRSKMWPAFNSGTEEDLAKSASSWYCLGSVPADTPSIHKRLPQWRIKSHRHIPAEKSTTTTRYNGTDTPNDHDAHSMLLSYYHTLSP